MELRPQPRWSSGTASIVFSHHPPTILPLTLSNPLCRYTRASLAIAAEAEAPIDGGDLEVEIAPDVPVKGISLNCVGFRPDYNPPGFTYKRREKAGAAKEKDRKRRAAAGMAPSLDDSGDFDPLRLGEGA